ncbi:MAG: hypothetical protein ACOCWL_01620 [Thermoguttaceae bacterium]
MLLGGTLHPVAAQQPPADVADEPDLPADEPEAPADEPETAADEAGEPGDEEGEPEATERPRDAGAAQLRPNIGKKPYLVVPVDDDLKRERNNVMSMLRAQKFESGEEDVFDAYYRRHFLPRWTQPSNLASLPLLRRELRNNLLSGKSGPPHSRLNAIILDYMGKMASANVHPAARVNAMLMIGELNEVEPVRAGDAPTPLRPALPVLLATLEDDEQIDPVKVAALVGIVRHAQFGQLTPESTQAIQRAMVELAGSTGAPARSADGQAWMRAQAAKALGFLGTVGEDGVVPRLLLTLVADKQLDMLVRCHAAEALGRLDYSGSHGVNAAQAVAALGQLAAEAIRAETDAFDNDPESFSRRRIKASLVAVHRALTGEEEEQSQGIGVLAGSSAEAKQAFTATQAEVEKLLAAFDERQITDDELVESLRTSLARLEPAGSPETARIER